MASNSSSSDLDAPREMGSKHNNKNDNNQPGPSAGPPSTGAFLGNTAATGHQGVSQGDQAGGMEEQKVKKMQRLHAAIEEERKAQIKENQRLEAEAQADKEEKERLEEAAQDKKEKEQKARIQRAIQATPEERAAYETAVNNAENGRNRERNRANTMASINGYLLRQGKKRR